MLDPILISVAGLGAAGAAIATVIGYGFTVLYSLFIVKKKSSWLSVSVKEISISGTFQWQILSVGLAATVPNIMQSFGVVFLNQALLPYGNDKIAAMGIAIKISLIVLMIIPGLTFGGQPLFGYYFGSRNRDCLQLQVVSMVLVGLIMLATILFQSVGMAQPALQQ